MVSALIRMPATPVKNAQVCVRGLACAACVPGRALAGKLPGVTSAIKPGDRKTFVVFLPQVVLPERFYIAAQEAEYTAVRT